MDPAMAAVFITALGAAVAAWWGSRNSSRAIDHARIIALEARMDKLETRYEIVVAYAQTLRDHIFRGSPPPPPEWPDLD